MSSNTQGTSSGLSNTQKPAPKPSTVPSPTPVPAPAPAPKPQESKVELLLVKPESPVTIPSPEVIQSFFEKSAVSSCLTPEVRSILDGLDKSLHADLEKHHVNLYRILESVTCDTTGIQSQKEKETSAMPNKNVVIIQTGGTMRFEDICLVDESISHCG